MPNLDKSKRNFFWPSPQPIRAYLWIALVSSSLLLNAKTALKLDGCHTAAIGKQPIMVHITAAYEIDAA
jgi:hypothetical protein